MLICGLMDGTTQIIALQTLSTFTQKHSVGVGGPDLILNKPGQEANSYVYIPMYHDPVPITVLAVQEPDLEEINQKTDLAFTKEEIVDFAVNELHARIIFWTVEAPWLRNRQLVHNYYILYI
jgi:hypothetical protein